MFCKFWTLINEHAKLGVLVVMILWPELPLRGNFLHARPGAAMLAVLPTKNWGERRVNRSAPVTVLVSAEYHVNRPNRPPTALPGSVNHFNVALSAIHATQSGVIGRGIILVIVMCVTNAPQTNHHHHKMGLLVLRLITALLLVRNAVAIATTVVKMLACIVVNM